MFAKLAKIELTVSLKPLETSNPRSRNSVPDNLKKQRGKRVYDLGLYGYVASLSAIGRAETVHHLKQGALLRSLLLP